MKTLVSTFILLLFTITANAQDGVYTSFTASGNTAHYINIGVDLNDNTDVYLTFSAKPTLGDRMIGVGTSYMPQIDDTIIIYGFDARLVTLGKSRLGAGFQVKSGVRLLDRLDITTGIGYMYTKDETFTPFKGNDFQPQIGISLRL